MPPLLLKYKFDNTYSEWIGKLELYFDIDHNGCTILSKRYHSGPFLVQRPFYPEGKTIPHVYLLHPPGGLVGGDKLILNVNLAPKSQVLLTMPSATKFYRSLGKYASLLQRFTLSNHSTLEWLPQLNILYPGANVVINNVFIIKNGAKLIGYETLCFGFPAIKKFFLHGKLDSKLDINLSENIGLQERLRINKSSYQKLGKHQMISTFFAFPVNIDILNEVRLLIKTFNIISGVTLLNNLLIVRLLVNDNRYINNILYSIWNLLRPLIIHRNAVVPRVWYT